MTDLQPRPPLVAVTTASGTRYELDLDGRRLRRSPAAVAQVGPVGVADLRRDATWIPFFQVLALKVGAPAVFVLEPLAPEAVAKIRISTPVVAIDPVEAFE